MLQFLLLFAAISQSHAADIEPPGSAAEHEPIQYFERYKPTFFLLGKINTKVQISFKVQAFRELPLYFGYSQLMIWDLFKTSSPFRDLNYCPEFFYRLDLGGDGTIRKHLDLGIFEHESNGKAGSESRSWDHSYLRYTSTQLLRSREFWWSLKLAVPYVMPDEASRDLPKRRGIWELQLGASDLFHAMFEVNELILRLYGGGPTWMNPLQGGQELTYREKSTSRKLLLPLYLQVFHGYGENLLDATEKRWGFRAGVGF